jgi:hypothetical protein
VGRKVKPSVKHHLSKLTKLHKSEALKKSRFSRANLAIFAIIFAAIGGYLIYSSFAATTTCTSHATTANFASTFSSSTGGQTICLAAGNYGTFNGGTKSSPGVIITSDTAAGGTQANVIFSSVTLSGSQNITLDNLTIGQAANDAFSIQSNVTNIAVTNSLFKGFTEIDNIGSTNHANVLFDHDNFSQTGVDCSNMGANAIIGLHYSGAGHSGVTVQNSVIGNSDCDGVHTGTGIDVLNNDFKNICEDSPTDPQHTDHMQFEGSTGGRIAGNYFHSLVPDSVCITQALTSFDSGTNGVIIENNVMDTSRGFGVEFYGDKNSIIRHNTVVYRPSGCATGACRGISISCRDATKANGGVSQCPPNAGFGTQVYDNLALPIDINHEGTNGPDPTLARNDHNFSAQGVTYMGGSNPPPAGGFASFSDYLLASNSTQKGLASDGLDPGIYANGGTNPTPPPPPPSDPTPPTVSLTAPTTGATVSGSAVTLSANASDNVGVSGVQFKVDGSNVGAEDTASPYSTTWDSRLATNGSHTITAVARDAAGNTTTSSAVTVTANNTTSCKTSDTTWQNNSFASQTGSFTFDFDATPSATNIDTLTGLSSGAATDYPNLAAIVLFTDTGVIQARNAGAYAAVNTLSYTAGTSYHFKMTVNVATHTYSVTVTPAGGAATTIATNYAFRTEQATVASLNNWSIHSNIGSENICGATLNQSTGPKQGDINGDNAVNITDLSLLLSSYGQTTTQCITNNTYKCDLSIPADNVVNIFDLSILLSKYGT